MFRLKHTFLYLIFLLSIGSIFAQNFKLSNAQSKLIVKGTSSLHDWYLGTSDMSGQVNFDLDSLLHIKKLTLLVQVTGLKGAKKGMIKKMRNTLQVGKFSTIAYQFKKTDKIIRLNNQKFSLKTTGNLTIASVSRHISLKLFITVKDNTVTVVGDKKLKMTDYKIKPPKALFGMLKTDDEIKVNFYVIYN